MYVNDMDSRKDELIFVAPAMEYADEIVSYRQEMLEANSSFDGCFSMKRMPNPKDFIEHCAGWADTARELGINGARGNVFLVLRKYDMKMVGCLQVHTVLNDFMQEYTGHIGYSVRPSERRKGYAKRILAYAIKYMDSQGFDEIFISCIPENEASKKTILSNGGEFIERVFFEQEDVYLNRYKIQIKAGA